MMEQDPSVKRDEQYPLLKVEGGGGDNNIRSQVPPTLTTTGWNIPKHTWCTRWPEFVSACWMTLILFAISFLIFYALGMSAYRRQPVVILRCNDTKPASDVFYHHIISRDTFVPFALFSEYLSHVARHYPSLRFYVYFLVDDSHQKSIQVSRHSRFLKRLVPQISVPFYSVFNQNYKREIRDFQRRYQNVNISIMYLSKYMATTPLKSKWRTIPITYLTFYARVYEIWQNGGIGFDLVPFNNQFNSHQGLDHRLDSILTQHNNGIQSEKYAKMLNALDKEESNELFSMFFINLFNNLINETCSFLNGELNTEMKIMDNSPIIRTHRSKRDVKIVDMNSSKNLTFSNETDTINKTEQFKKGGEKELSNNTMNLITVKNIAFEKNNETKYQKSNTVDILNDKTDFMITNYTDFFMPQIFIYDFSVISSDTGPDYKVPKQKYQYNLPPIQGLAERMQVNQEIKRNAYLTLSSDGLFMAASSRFHPFLARLITAGCQKQDPKYAIKNILINQCSGFIRDNVFCENIRIIYNVI